MSSIGAKTSGNGDLIDRIAKALPLDVRADFYRELNYCRSLPEQDEMLRILRVMQFLTLLMNQVPLRIVEEREKLELLFGTTLRKLQEAIERSDALNREIAERLSELPAAVARGLSPPAIAREVNESLRQQFVRSTIPETSQSLSSVANDLKRVSADFAQAAEKLTDTYDGAVRRAQVAVENLDSSASRATDGVRKAAEKLSHTLREEFRSTLYILLPLILLIGFIFGIQYHRWLVQPTANPDIQNVQPHQTMPLPKQKHH